MFHFIRLRSTAISFLLVLGIALIPATSMAAPPEAARRPVDTVRGHVPVRSPRSNEATALNPQPLPPRSDAATALNPQPLPPKSSNHAPNPAVPAAAKGSETSIIIVSGKSDKPLRKQKHLGKPSAGTINGKTPAQGVPFEH